MDATIEHTGVIKAIDGSTARVLIDQRSACVECHARSACTASDKTEKVIEARIVDGQFAVGETVMIIGQKSIGVQAVIIAYVLPFVLIIATLFIANSFSDNELIVGTAGLAILIPYFIVVRSMRDRLQARFQFYVSKI